MPKHPSSSKSNPDTQAYWLGRWFTGARRSGILAHLKPEGWHTLSGLLSFTTREGRRIFTLDQLASALGVSRSQADTGLSALSQVMWQQTPLLTLELDRDGAVAGASLALIEGLAEVVAPEPTSAEDPKLTARSVESLSTELSKVGLNTFQIDWLRRTFTEQRIRRQLQWLPAREAHNPPALLIRAIEQDWDAPKEGI